MGGREGVLPRFLALVGATASGKTSLSLALARHLAVEIISMDSRQIYRGMDVGTGKATPAERARVPHHGLDLRNPDERYSAGQFSRDARGWMAEIHARGRTPLLVGGTGFFLRALTDPMFAEPPMDQDRLTSLRSWLAGLSMEALQEWVAVLDPDRKEVGREGGRHRATRVVEMALMTGRTLSWWHAEGEPSEPPVPGVVVVLEHPRDVLYQRINQRVLRMVEAEGLLDEVRGLLAAGYGPEDPGMTGAGYREAVAHLRGQCSREEMVEEIRKSHRRYARRQITWYRHQLSPRAYVLDAGQEEADMVNEVLSIWAQERDPVKARGEEGVGTQPRGEEGEEE